MHSCLGLSSCGKQQGDSGGKQQHGGELRCTESAPVVLGTASTLPGGAARYSCGERAAQGKRFVFWKTLPMTWEGRELRGLERGFSVTLLDGMFCLFSLSRADCKFREGAHAPV